MKKTISIDGRRIHDIETFYNEINQVFMEGVDWKLGQSLDALNDMLHGGYGKIEGNEPIDLIWMGFEKNRNDLGSELTKSYYLNKLDQPTKFDTTWVKGKLKELENGTGKTYFEIVLEIISDHQNINLIPR